MRTDLIDIKLTDTRTKVIRARPSNLILGMELFFSTVFGVLLYQETASFFTPMLVISPAVVYFLYKYFNSASRVIFTENRLIIELPISELSIKLTDICEFKIILRRSAYIVKLKLFATGWKSDKKIVLVCTPWNTLISFDKVVKFLETAKKDKLRNLLEI
jgi:hypothetical protein